MERHRGLYAPTPNKEKAKKDECMVKGVTCQIRRMYLQVLQVILKIAGTLIMGMKAHVILGVSPLNVSDAVICEAIHVNLDNLYSCVM